MMKQVLCPYLGTSWAGVFVKSIAKGVKNIGKGVVKGVSGLAMCRCCKKYCWFTHRSIAIPAAAMFLAPQLGITSLLGKSALAGSATGLTFDWWS